MICPPCGPLPSGSHAVSPNTLPSKPPPMGCHAVPFHSATWLTVVEPDVTQLPPATSRGGSGPLPSGSLTASANVLPFTNPLPSACQLVPSQMATRLTVAPPVAVVNEPPATK